MSNKLLIFSLSLGSLLNTMEQSFDQRQVQLLAQLYNLSDTEQALLYSVKVDPDVNDDDYELPLFEQYPILQHNTKTPFIQLADLPTPIDRIEKIEEQFSIGGLYIKRDDLSGVLTNGDQCRLFGGNKIRKLEFLLADAKRSGAKRVITLGAAGSNHAACTATYATLCGLQSTLILAPQEKGVVVKRNLLIDYAAGARIIIKETEEERKNALIEEFMVCKQADGIFPYLIPVGGSSALGALGFVNAILELKQDIADKKIAEPDYIYVPIGSAGTVAGMIIGLHCAKLKSKLIGVAVEPIEDLDVFKKKIGDLVIGILDLLEDAGAPVTGPCITLPCIDDCPDTIDDHIVINTEHCGAGYGICNDEGLAAKICFGFATGIELDLVYTSKAFAALLCDAKHGLLKDKTVLFWNTFYSQTPSVVHDINYKKLPRAAHPYFELSEEEYKQMYVARYGFF
jgi:1-aminocyclopropane-1-carboxylate deaminase/D-cysteine desulfhydrase-like pyridoxal-dependent ACC family enzyme